jgi:non-specific serine/threonine protein kinase
VSAQVWATAHQKGLGLGLTEALSLALALDKPPAGPTVSEAVAGTTAAGSVLSPRETEVASLIAQGLSNREIAAGLVITEKTAANHVEHIMAKLNLRSRAQIAVWAVRHGLAPAV